MVWQKVNRLNIEVIGFVSVVKVPGTATCKYRWIYFALPAVRHWI
jgi:hypothetical protein